GSNAKARVNKVFFMRSLESDAKAVSVQVVSVSKLDNLYFHDELANIAAGEKPIDSFRRFREPFDDGFTVPDFTEPFPFAELHGSLHEFRRIIENDESLNAQALHQNHSKAFKRRIFFGIAGNQATEHNAAVQIHALQDGMHDIAAD